MGLKISWIFRGKFPLMISGFINIILITGFITIFMKQGGDTDHKVARRGTFSLSAPETINGQKGKACFMFLLIFTSPGGENRRNAIRQTWLKLDTPKDFPMIHKFVVGTLHLEYQQKRNLIAENDVYKDIIFLDELRDSYKNLTLKLLHSFMWISKNIDSKFVMKVDDDSFVRLGVLVRDLEKKRKYGRIYWGFFRGDANVKSRGPWAEPNWVLCDKYLPYADGGGYVLSQELVHHISRQSEMLQLYNSEDVSVGTWLAPVRLNRVHDVRFDTEYKSRGCNNKHIVSHKQTINDMHMKYEELKNKNHLCAVEKTERLSFEYDWQAKPSQCCKRMRGIP